MRPQTSNTIKRIITSLFIKPLGRTFFGMQCGGLFLTYNTLPFGWKISPYVYHTTGLLSSSYSSAIGSLCLLYIDDRHNGSCRYRWTKVNTRHRLLSMNVIRQQPDQLFSLLRIILLNWATSLARRSRS